MENQNPELSADELVPNFVENLIIDKGLKFSSQEERDSFCDDLEDRVNEKIERAIYGALPDDELLQVSEEFKKDDPDEDKIMNLVTGAGVDAGEIMSETLLKFREEFLKGDK